MRRFALLAFVALTVPLVAVPAVAHAEEDAAEARVSANRDAIIVTARRRAEDVQSVPASLTVVSTDTLTRTYTVNTNQLSQLVPTLNYSSPNPRNTAFTIRGLGSSVVAISQANDGLEPGVGFYVDQVYMPALPQPRSIWSILIRSRFCAVRKVLSSAKTRRPARSISPLARLPLPLAPKPRCPSASRALFRPGRL